MKPSALLSSFLAAIVLLASPSIQSHPPDADVSALETIDQLTTGAARASMTNIPDAVPLSGEPASDPCCVSRDNLTTFCFFRATDSYVYGQRMAEGSTWKSLRLKAVGDIECVKKGNGDIVVIAVDLYNAVKSLTIKGTNFGRWTRTTAKSAKEVPGCTAQGDDTVACMFRNFDGEASTMVQVGTHWRQPLDEKKHLYSPAACFGNKDSYRCFSTDKSFNLIEYSSAYRKWKGQGVSYSTSRPSLTSHKESVIDVCVLSAATNQVVWKEGLSEGRYKYTQFLKGSIAFPPTCVGGDNRVDCYAVSLESWFVSRTWNGSMWTSWKRAEDGYTGRPSCVYTDASTISCFVRNAKSGGIDRLDFEIKAPSPPKYGF